MSAMTISQAIEAHLGPNWRTDYPDDQAVADIMNTPSIQQVGSVSIADLLGWAGSIDAFARLTAVANLPDGATLADGSPDPRLAVRGPAGAALRLFDTVQALDLTRSDVQQMMDALVAAGIFSAAERDSLWVLGTKTLTPCEFYQVKSIEWDDVMRSR